MMAALMSRAVEADCNGGSLTRQYDTPDALIDERLCQSLQEEHLGTSDGNAGAEKQCDARLEGFDEISRIPMFSDGSSLESL